MKRLWILLIMVLPWMVASAVDINLAEEVLDITPMFGDTLVPIRKTVHGVQVEIQLNGQFSTEIHLEDHEYPLKLWESRPGVLFIQKYHVRTGYNEWKELPFKYELPVVDRVEFYDSQHQILSIYDVDANNPYLKPNDSIKVMPYFFDSEGISFLLEDEHLADDGTGALWLETIVSGNGNESKSNFIEVTYMAYEVSKSNRMLGVKTTQVILDTEGRKIFSKEFPNKTSTPVVANDGGHLLFSILPIEAAENAGMKTQDEGFEIWDINKNMRIYKSENDNPDMWIAEPVKDELSGWLCVDYTFPNSIDLSRHQYLFDPQEEILYDRIIKTSEMNEFTVNWFKKYRSWKSIIDIIPFRKQILGHD